jgi:hypothetical protein
VYPKFLTRLRNEINRPTTTIGMTALPKDSAALPPLPASAYDSSVGKWLDHHGRSHPTQFCNP